MSKLVSSFRGYQIYKKKFLVTVLVAVLLSLVAFCGIVMMLIRTWSNTLYQESQNYFWENEYQLENIKDWIENYVDGIYEDTKLMEDAKAFFEAEDEYEYVQQRRINSLSSSSQISSMPADIHRILEDNRNEITGVTVRSEAGIKVLYLENGFLKTCYGMNDADIAESIPQIGNMLLDSKTIRNPRNINQIMGTIDFWIDCSSIYDSKQVKDLNWNLVSLDDFIMIEHDKSEKGRALLQMIVREKEATGWLVNLGEPLAFYAKYESGVNNYSYVIIRKISDLFIENIYIVLAIFVAFVLIVSGVIITSYLSIRTDSIFLSYIMENLSDIKSGQFEWIQERELPVIHQENEYGMIALTLKDVGMKLKNYIETEYKMRLKEQEAQMRALQHQINPHFLYNTLEMLRSMALIHSDGVLAEAIAGLGGLYRARTYKKNSITLKEEFELLDMYLNIMILRNEGRFVYKLELEPEVENIPTINFWLQPLAENFFAHGFDENSEYNLLLISGRARNEGVEIEVIDNGMGIEPEMLEKIQHSMQEEKDYSKEEIGLCNVFIRLKYFYGDGLKMQVGNNPEGGFRILIFIPGKGETNVHVADS